VALFIIFSCEDITDGNSSGNGNGNNNGTAVPGETLAEKLQWLTYNAESGNSYLLEISSVYESLAPQQLYFAGRSNITIQLIGKSSNRVIEISLSKYNYGSLFTITNGITLILDNNITLVGNNSNSNSLITVNTGGTLILNEGAKISGNMSNYGGGVSVSGTFTMNGGKISSNSASYGGGVYVSSGGTFIMNYGEISSNSAFYGGGVYIHGALIKSGGIITGYASDILNGNKVYNNYGDVQIYQGHAVYWAGFTCDTTLGEFDNMNFSNLFGNSATILTTNSWANGNIATEGGSQWFKFSAIVNTQYIHINFGLLYNLSIQLYNSVGNAVGEESYLYSSTKYISRTVTSGQEYYVRVRANNSSSGTYQITFNTSSTPPAL